MSGQAQRDKFRKYVIGAPVALGGSATSPTNTR